MLQLYNSRTRQKEVFTPLRDDYVGVYTCGPTVYNYAHVGNLRTYVFEDTLRRVLAYNGYNVRHVMNITDVGHLTDDADTGEDKMEKGSRREGKSAADIDAFYTAAFMKNLTELEILPPHIWCKATDHIPEQINQVKTLIDRGFTYETDDGIYFDTTRCPDYGQMAQLKKQSLRAGTRVAIGDKKNPHDFALWKFSRPEDKRQMEWAAFGKKGFPGWHIECSAMSMKYLGEQFDIHCGGVDHIPVHHTNEIAQAEGLTTKRPWVLYWLHGEHLLLTKSKMAKSGDNFITLEKLGERGIPPLAFRYWLLQAHYRQQLTFSWAALEAAQSGLAHLYNIIRDWTDPPRIGCAEYEAKFLAAINDDLNTPEALTVMWNLVKSDYPAHAKMASLKKFDLALGLNLTQKPSNQVVPIDVQKLLATRELARTDRRWSESDRLRDEIKQLGFTIEDTAKGQRLIKDS
ncbi:MAG: cysteine--tRNA ligase [Candidatus Magasanikbacteria bacterium]|nr:cysteine--tRNA ligase [Candidatus Magasanikbacteria bacterium]